MLVYIYRDKNKSRVIDKNNTLLYNKIRKETKVTGTRNRPLSPIVIALLCVAITVYPTNDRAEDSFGTGFGDDITIRVPTFEIPKAEEVPKVESPSIAIPKDEATTKSEAIYYGADCREKIFKFVTGPMTFTEAMEWINKTAILGGYGKGASWGIYTQNKKDAFAFGLLFSNGKLEDHTSESGVYPHYHVNGFNFKKGGREYRHFHFWYGTINP